MFGNEDELQNDIDKPSGENADGHVTPPSVRNASYLLIKGIVQPKIECAFCTPNQSDFCDIIQDLKSSARPELKSVNVCFFSLRLGINDLLTFYDGDDLTANILGQYSGILPRFRLYTSTADVTIQFQSDPASNIYGYNNGFVVHFFGR